MANLSLTASVTGLGSVLSVVAPTTDTYTVKGKITLPTIGQGDAATSALVVVVNQNGSPIYTGAAGSRGFRTLVNCTAGDVCVICEKSCPSGRRLAVDHEHSTGTIRGLLCINCNKGLGNFKDNIELLEAAIQYLKNYKEAVKEHNASYQTA